MEAKTRRILWIIVVVVIIAALAAYAVFAIHKHNSLVAQGTSKDEVASTIKHQQFTQYNAPTGLVISGFPSKLLATDVTVTSSYHNQYNGLEQYTVNAEIGEAMAMIYVDYQSLLKNAGLTMGKTTSSEKIDTINATQGNNYLTIQLTPQSNTITNIVANYGVPSTTPAPK